MTRAEDRILAEELLPFHVNGTLDGDEKDAVEAALKVEPDLAAEAAALSEMRTRMQAEDMGYSPGDMGLARLMRDIDSESVAPKSRFAGFGAGFAIAAVLAMAAFLVAPMLQPNAPVYYEQASGDAGDLGLTVAFRSDATQAQISDLLLNAGAVIIDGPTALGLYRIAPLDGADLTALAETLRASPTLIESVDTQ